MTRFRIFLHKRQVIFWKDFLGRIKNEIIEKLKQLIDFPNVRLDIVKIAGEPDTFRLRIEDYRALFKIYERERTIVIVKTDIRGRVYHRS